MGAWIEILYVSTKCTHKLVAPGMGAWIEILLIFSLSALAAVAPGMGAWIEISTQYERVLPVSCRSRYGSVD